MAVAAGQLTGTQRMMRWLLEIRTHLLVTAITNLGLGGLFQHRILGSVDGMATCTGNVVTLVHTAFPANVVAVTVAMEAHSVLGVHGIIRLGAEI